MQNPHFRPAQRLESLSKTQSLIPNRKLETYKLVFGLLKHLTTDLAPVPRTAEMD